MGRVKSPVFLAVLFFAAALFGSAGYAHAEKPTALAPCIQCHKAENDVVRGTLVSVSEKFRTISVQVGSKLVWVVAYDDDLKVNGADKLSSIPKEKEISIRFTGDEKKPVAKTLAVKPPAKVAAEKLVSIEEMKQLVEQGPAKGNYILVDSRPKARYLEGHIPYAVSMPLDKFDELKDKVLPAEKDRLVVFYCGGVT